MSEHDLDGAISVLMETCDCAACERLRRAERRRVIAAVYAQRLKRSLSVRGAR